MPIEYEAGYAVESVWMLWRMAKSFGPVENEISFLRCPALNFIIIPTVL
jgi:hypothetical protein